MNNDISANQSLQPHPHQLDETQQLIPKESEFNELAFDFNDSDKTAYVTGNILDYADICLPLSIKRGSKEYDIIGIKEGSFESSFLATLQFPSNSKVQIIEKKMRFDILFSSTSQFHLKLLK